MQNEKIIIISDPLSDVDDILSFVIASELDNQKYFNLVSVVTTIGDEDIRTKRAKFARGCFQLLGHHDLPISVGLDYSLDTCSHNYSYTEIAESKLIEQKVNPLKFSIAEVWQDIFASSIHKSISFVINAQMFDVYDFIKDLNKDDILKINKLVIMGGLDSLDGSFYPHKDSYNNKVCYDGALSLFTFAKDHDIKMIFVPKETVYEVQVDKEFYQEIKKYNNDVSSCIVASNEAFFYRLWEDVKGNKYSHFDIKRFSKVFCGDEDILDGTEEFDALWAKVKGFNLYDAIAVLAVVEPMFEDFGYYEKVIDDKDIYIAKVKDKTLLVDTMKSLILKKISSL